MSSPALRLGVSHQTPETLTPSRLRFLRQMGVEKIEVRIPSSASGYDDICRVRDTVEGAGLGLHEIMLADRYSCRPIAGSNRDAVAARMTPAEISEAQNKVVDWKLAHGQ